MEEMEQEQGNLDKHDDSIAALSVRLQLLVLKSNIPTVTSDVGKKAPPRKRSRLERSLVTTEEEKAIHTPS